MRGHPDSASPGTKKQEKNGIVLSKAGTVSGPVPQRLGVDVLIATALRSPPLLFIHINSKNFRAWQLLFHVSTIEP